MRWQWAVMHCVLLMSADDLKQKLLYTSLELETVKMEANEGLKKHKEDVKHLLNLLNLAYQERDEAKDQLQKLLNPISTHHHTLVVPTKANSSITESNSLSSPVDSSFFDAVSSPEFSNINNKAAFVDSSNMGGGGGGFVNQQFAQDIDTGTAVIDSIAQGKALPQQGKLLQAVMEAGPLFQTLLVVGPLPRWRNPPPLQPFKIPPFLIHQKPAALSRIFCQMCSTSMLNFSGKRQKFQ